MQLCFFEDAKYENFHPLTLTRPVDDLRIGILTIAEKWQKELETTAIHHTLKSELATIFPTGDFKPQDNYLWINSRYLPSDDLITQVSSLDEGQCLQNGDTIIAAKINGKLSQSWIDSGAPDFNSLFVLETQNFSCISNLWDLFQKNGDEIVNDIARLDPKRRGGSVAKQTVLVNENDIYIEEDAEIEAGCVLNAQNGPIYIGKNAKIMSGAHIRGPVAICNGATVKMVAKIYGDTTIGPVCKVGGEVNNTIFHSYSNKAHDGFVGNSLIGQWCNLGADTNTSNLKNNYSMVRITDWHSRDTIQTNQQFFGTVMGDHSKTAIDTQLNTGTLCGVSCNIFSGDFPPKLIPSFSWVGSNVIQTYKLEKALEAMEAMMARRNVGLTENYRQMIEYIFKNKRG